MKLGERIASVRKSRHMSGAELARRAGISKGYLHAIEHNAKVSPGVDVFAAIAVELGVSMDWLYRGSWTWQ